MPPIQHLELLHSAVWSLSSQSPPRIGRTAAVPAEHVCEGIMDDPSGAIECCFLQTQMLAAHGVLLE